MATTEQITELRRLINEPDNAEPWTDAALGLRIDAVTSLTELAATIWSEKAAQYAGLVDVKEGSSDRKLSQLHRQALDMAASFGAGDSTARGARTRRIERQ
jgi:hypothetical protein